jgi:hypothetical protein
LSQINVSATELINNEMIELRTSNSKTFQTDDGSGKMVLYNHDVHFSTQQQITTLEQLYSNVIADLNFLGIGYRLLSGPNDNTSSNEVIIAMRLGINSEIPSLKDYHFVVKHSNGRWVHKPSKNPSELFCSSAYTPDEVVWKMLIDDEGKIFDQYDSETIYIAVTF